MRFNSSNRFNHRQRFGATAIEFAFVAPVFFLLLFAGFEFARLSMMRNLTQDAAYFAARHAMVPGGTETEAVNKANEILGYLGTQGATVVINNDQGLDIDSDAITVTVTVPVAQNSFIISQFSNEINFTATATVRTERYDGFYDPFTFGNSSANSGGS